MWRSQVGSRREYAFGLRRRSEARVIVYIDLEARDKATASKGGVRVMIR